MRPIERRVLIRMLFVQPATEREEERRVASGRWGRVTRLAAPRRVALSAVSRRPGVVCNPRAALPDQSQTRGDPWNVDGDGANTREPNSNTLTPCALRSDERSLLGRGLPLSSRWLGWSIP